MGRQELDYEDALWLEVSMERKACMRTPHIWLT